MNEDYKPIPNISGYLVSNFGNVKNELTGKVRKLTERRGYLKLNISGKSYDVHRLVALAFLENPENKNFVNHIDGNKQNNFLNNLEWATESENTRHAYSEKLLIPKKGTEKFGCKLSEKSVEEVKKMIKDNVLVKDIAVRYSVSRQLISKIKSGNGWAHVFC